MTYVHSLVRRFQETIGYRSSISVSSSDAEQHSWKATIMASDKRTVEYLVEQMGEAGAIRSRPMFGEFGIYCDDVFVALVCDNQLFVKAAVIANEYLGDENLAPPYPGARDAYRVPEEKLDDRVWLSAFVRATALELVVSPTKKRSRLKKRATAD